MPMLQLAELKCIVGYHAAPSPLKTDLKIKWETASRDKYDEELLCLWEAENPAGMQPQRIWIWTVGSVQQTPHLSARNDKS